MGLLCYSLQDFYKFYEVTGLKWKVSSIMFVLCSSNSPYFVSFWLLLMYMYYISLCYLGTTQWRTLVWWPSTNDLPHFQRQVLCFLSYVYATKQISLLVPYSQRFLSTLIGINLLVKSKAFQYAMCKCHHLHSPRCPLRYRGKVSHLKPFNLLLGLQMWWWPSMVCGSSWRRTRWIVRAVSVTLNMKESVLRSRSLTFLSFCRRVFLVQICPLELHCFPDQWVDSHSHRKSEQYSCKTDHRGCQELFKVVYMHVY